MQTRKLGRTGLKVSELCLGAMTFGWTADEATAFRILEVAVEAGINFIDTANIYARWATRAGISEEILGNWFKRTGRRQQIILATKVRGPMGDGPNDQGLSRRHILQAVEDSLRRLQTDYIDLYQTHWFDEETPVEETMRALDDLVRQGKVRYLGCSNHPAWRLCRALWVSDKLGLARYDSLQPHYNLLHRQEFEQELMPLCLAEGIGVMPYSPLAGGFLTGKYRRGQAAPPGTRGEHSANIQRYMSNPRNYDLIDKLEELGRARGKTIAQMALAWVLANPAVSSAIIGANTVEQLQDNLGAAGIRLSEEELKTVDELTAWA